MTEALTRSIDGDTASLETAARCLPNITYPSMSEKCFRESPLIYMILNVPTLIREWRTSGQTIRVLGREKEPPPRDFHEEGCHFKYPEVGIPEEDQVTIPTCPM